MAKKKIDADKDLLTRIRERYSIMVEADRDNRSLAEDDMKFVNVPGAQWDDNMKQERGDRPCYEFNKVRVTGKRIINEMRANRPSGKVRGFEDGDKKIAEIYEGLIRNICNTSDFDGVIDHAAEYQVNGGMGAWRVKTEYASDDVFDQHIVVESIPNPLCLYADPSAKDMLKRDAEDWILTERLSNSAFKAKYPDAEPIDWEQTEFDDQDEWADENSTRVAEYWWKEPVEKELWQLDDGKVISADSDEAEFILPETIRRTRTVKTHEIKMCVVSGDAVLEQPKLQAGKEHRFVVIYGEYVIVDGKTLWFGIPRFARDAQQAFNVAKTSVTETIAQAPLEQFWATTKQAEGNTDNWAEAHKKNFPFKLYTPDPQAPGAPQKMGGANVPVALIQELQLSSELIKDVTGIFGPDLGAGDQAKSGVQERERRAQGQIATFNYQDNQAKGVLRTWEILIDLIPHIFDTERELRILGSDDAEKYVKVNSFVQDPQTGEAVKVNDLTHGRYDVTIDVGPSYSTRRQEAAEAYSQLAGGNEGLMAVIGDLIFKSMDLPYSEDIAERLKAMLPPQVQAVVNKDENMSPEMHAAMQEVNQKMQLVDEQMKMVQAAAQETEQEKALAEKEQAEVKTLIANLKIEEANFEKQVAQRMAKIAADEAKLRSIETDIKQSAMDRNDEQYRVEVAQERVLLSQQLQESVQAINDMAANFVGQAMNTIQAVQEQKMAEPKIVRIEQRRENGALVATPIYEETA